MVAGGLLAVLALLLVVLELVAGATGLVRFLTAGAYPAHAAGVTSRRRAVSITYSVVFGLAGPAIALAAWWGLRGAYGERGQRLAATGLLTCLMAVMGVVMLAYGDPLPTGVAPVPTVVVPETGFGGYHERVEVREISARWRVPTIAPTSSPGFAATWVGAQSDRGGFPFIQLGVNEEALSAGAGHGVALSYQGFWSDTTVGFHPVRILALDPGDLVSASMAQDTAGWRLVLDDRTTGKSAARQVNYGPGASYQEAEWVQEDPTDGRVVAQDLPYPTMGDVRFSDLTVDGAQPELDLADGQTLTTSGATTILVPSAVTHDGFTLRPPTGAATDYLEAAASLDAAISRFSAELADWRSTGRPQRSAEERALAQAYETNAAKLLSQTWPSTAGPLMDHLAGQMQVIVRDLRRWAAAGLPEHGEAYRALLQAERIGVLADEARARLGLPPP